MDLYYACDEGDEAAALQALAAGADVNRPCGPEDDVELPLLIAVIAHHVDLVRRLVAPPISADVNLRCGELGRTALHWACSVGSLEAVEVLLAAGADPTATTTRSNQSVLHLTKDPGVLRYLLQLGLPLDDRDKSSLTPLLHACCGGKLECVEALLAAGADIHATNNQGWGVLHWSALMERAAEAMQLLLDHGKAIGRPLNIEAPAKDGRTLLMHAARCVQPVMVEALLAGGADITAVDHEGCTALHYTHRGISDPWSEQQVYQLLISAGGDVFALDN